MTKKQARATEAAVSKAEMAQEREKQMANELNRVERAMKMEKQKTKREALSEYTNDIKRMQNKKSQLAKSIENLHTRSVYELDALALAATTTRYLINTHHAGVAR